MEKIRHLVVLMLENRSFDNMVGYVYAQDGNHPPINIPHAPSTPTYDGLLNPDDFWNPGNEDFFEGRPATPKIPVTKIATDLRMPNPDPREQFIHITAQLFGPNINPVVNVPPGMKGFAVDYSSVNGADSANIMQCYGPDQVPVITKLAREYAISDRWFASSPTLTWPNRAFVHLGTSLGKVNNPPYDPFHYDVPTIFNVLEKLTFAPWGELISWGVYKDTILPSLTRLQFPKLWNPALDGHFHLLHTFKEQASAGTLPTYSFIEPSFIMDPNDQHPPHDVRLGEQLIHEVYEAVSTGKGWEQTLLVITYDEHGGCYDHVPPPWTATAPDQQSDPSEAGFGFNRFGVRVPALLISPYIKPGTVFRSASHQPYDHTSILATIRDWLQIPKDKMLPSKRIEEAPTLGQVLTLESPRPEPAPETIPSHDSLAAWRVSFDISPNDVQKSIVVALESKRLGRTLAIHELQELIEKIPTRRHLLGYLHISG